MACLALQFYLAGIGMFGAANFELHRVVGYFVALFIILLLIFSLIARMPTRILGLSALLIVLVVVQVLLPSLRGSLPWIAALHPVNAMALLGVTAAISRSQPSPS
jgi:cytochrome b